jgi:hypothetical protein
MLIVSEVEGHQTQGLIYSKHQFSRMGQQRRDHLYVGGFPQQVEEFSR